MQEKGRRRKAVAITTLGGIAASGVFLGLLPGSTFNQDALEDASYSGAISYVPEFFSGIDAMEKKYQTGLTEISNQYSYLADLRDDILESQDIPDDAIGIALMSDQHCAQAGWQLAGRIIASDPRIKFALSAGDHVDFGTELENQLCFNGIEDIDVPIIAIAANHDDPEVTMDYLKSKSVRILNHSSAIVEGVSVYGYPDLSHSPSSTEGASREAQEYIDIPGEPTS
jgi:Icc-related predicted phosphoesterase